MRSASIAAAASLLLAAPAPARGDSTDGMVRWDVERRQLQPSSHRLLRRAGQTFEEVITNEKTRGGYFSTVQIGTPPQAFTLQLDTGSSDIWVPYSGSDVCRLARQTGGCQLGSFNYTRSRTFVDVGPGAFNISYVDGSSAFGDYFTDTFEIGGATLKNLTMGLAFDTDVPYGLVGVGYEINEASVAVGTRYPNLPVAMQQGGLINTVAYSLWLNDLGANTGSILFGGIDTDKYVGDLTRVNILKDERVGTFTHFTVALSSLTAVSSSGSDALRSPQFPMPVVLDSGTTLSYLPTDVAQQIWNEVGAVYLASDNRNPIQMAVLPCSRATVAGNFTFGFAGQGGPQIAVGMDELVVDLTGGNPPKFSSRTPYAGQTMCAFGLQNFSAPPYLLGDTFLRSAYVVYDLENNEIGLAATDFNATSTNLMSFPSLGAQIPSSTPAPNQDQIGSGGSGGQPGFSAAPGFQSSASRPGPFGWSGFAVALVSTFFVAVGGGLFVLI